MSTAPKADSPPVDDGFIKRGVKGPSPPGTALFVGLRAADPIFQYQILRHDWGSRIINALGSSTLPHGPTGITNTVLDNLGLSPYRMILLAMAAGSALKQNYWLLAISYEKMPPSASLAVAAFNTVNNAINNLMFICRATSASVNGEHFPQTPLVIGSIMYLLGIAIEVVSEQQRYRFKRDGRNKGRAFTGGLFSVVRHANYAGFVIWKSGYAMAAGGYIYAALSGAFYFWNFTNAIPPLDEYCTEHYGQQWVAYKQKTPWKMLPGIY